MNSPKPIRNVFLAALVAVPLSVSGPLASMGRTAQAWGQPVNGLQMSISRAQEEPGQTNNARLRIELRNTGETDLVLKLGIMLANGKKQYPTDISLMLTDPQGKTHRLKLPGPAYIAGRMDPFVVPLPGGASFSIPVDLSNCWPEGPGGLNLKDLKGGPYLLEAQFTGTDVPKEGRNLDMLGITLMPYWKGTVTSNRLRFEVSAQ